MEPFGKLSAGFTQVLFFSDKNKKGEKEFLNEYFPDYRSLSRAIFLKGYQWPFDPSRISGCGSSLIDLLVFSEKKKGRRVFMEFRKKYTWEGDDTFSALKLDNEVRNYLESSDSLRDTPIKRLHP